MVERIRLLQRMKIGLIILLTAFPVLAQSPAANRQVLIIHSYHSGLSWTDSIMNGIRDAFARSAYDVQVSAEYLDARRHVDSRRAREIRAFVVSKLKGTSPDLVMVSDNDAIQFMLEQRDLLFPGVPIVFCGINDFSPSLISNYHDITGVSEEVSIAETIDIALRLRPKTERIVVIGRTSVAADIYNRKSFVKALPGLPPRVKVAFWDDLSCSELKTRLEKLGGDSVVFINGLITDETGRQLMYGETTRWISRYSPVPLYSLWDVYLGYGIVGGKLVSGYRQGQLAAELALRILNGESANRLPVVNASDANRYMFDYNQLVRFGLPLSQLPKDAVLVNRPDSFYGQYKGFVWATVIVILILSGFVALLSMTIIRRRKVEEALRQANLVVENSPAVLFRWGAAKGWPVEFVSKNIIQFGYTPEDFLSGKIPFASIVYPEDLERVSSEVQAHSASGVQQFEQEYRIVTRDGRVRWLDDRTVVERDAYGKIVRYQGVVIDITDRRQAEEALRAKTEELDGYFTHALDLLCIADTDGYFRRLNKEWETRLGYSIQELEGTRFLNYVHPEDLDATMRAVAQLVGHEEVLNFVNRYRAKNGSYRWIEWRSFPAGKLIYAVARDITERKRVEDTLRTRAQQLETLRLVSAEITRELDLTRLLGLIHRCAASLLGVRYGFLSLYDETTQTLTPKSWEGHGDWVGNIRFQLGQGISGTVAAQRRGMIVNDYRTSGYEMAVILDHTSLTSVLAEPLICRDRLVGVVTLDNQGAPERTFTEEDREILAFFAAQAAIAVENARLFQAVQRELAERTQAEAALQRSESVMRATIESISDGLLVVSEVGQIPHYNRQFLELWSIPSAPSDEQDNEVFIRYASLKLADPRQFKERIRAIYQSSTPSEDTFLLNDGRTIERRSYPVAFPNNKRGRVWLFRDVTERKRAEERMHQLQNDLRSIIDSMPSVLVGVNREGRVTQWNKAAEQETRVTAEEALGQSVDQIFPRLRRELEKAWQAMRTRTVEREAKVRRIAAGEARYEDVTIYPLMREGMDEVVIRVDDVTERVRIEEMMIQSEKMLSVGGLAAGMAHEINNPLGVILHASQNVLRRVSPDLPANVRVAEECGTTLSAVKEYLERREILTFLEDIRKSGQRAGEIVANMLGFSRMAEGERRSADLAELLDRTVSLAASDYDLKKRYDFRRIEIVRLFEAGVPPVFCRAGMIQQVFLNILRNGAEAMREIKDQGYVPRFTLRVVQEGMMVRVEIEDNGPGMDESTRRRVFEPFFTTKAPGLGTGLGLSVSYFIVTEEHGGRISVESTPDRGARFIIHLPVEGQSSV